MARTDSRDYDRTKVRRSNMSTNHDKFAEHILEKIMFRTNWASSLRDKLATELEQYVIKHTKKLHQDLQKAHERRDYYQNRLHSAQFAINRRDERIKAQKQIIAVHEKTIKELMDGNRKD